MHKFDLKDTDVVIIPEQHLYYKPIITVPDMVKDNDRIIQELLSLVKTLTNPIVIFMGDIVHQGIKSTENSYFIEDFFRSMSLYTEGRVLSVVGNHELSYRKNNPFWGVSFIDSEFIKSIVKHTYSVKQPLIGVIDDLVINDTQYAFGHYERRFTNTYTTLEGVKQVVLLSHNSLICNEIIDAMNNKGKGIDSRFINVRNLHDGINMPRSALLKMVYVGHLHKAHGVFQVQESISGLDLNFTIRYLASLGRTNHTEYDDDTEREIPIHIFRDGKFIEERIHTIELPSRSVSVDERVVLENREAYDRQKQKRELKKVSATSMDLIDAISVSINNKPELMDLFERTKGNQMDVGLITLLNKYRSW